MSNSPRLTELTLSDFYNMEIFTRENGTRSVLIDTYCGKPIGLIGYNAPEGASDLEIKEGAFLYYKLLMEQLNEIID